MILSTTNSVDGRTIAEYMRIVGGEAIVGMNVFKDFAAGIRNIVGGRAAAWETEVVRAREEALNELWHRAAEMGADAVVGVKVDYESMGADGGMMLVSAVGTAVKLAPPVV